MCLYLEKEEIIDLNLRTIIQHGGNRSQAGVVANLGSLDYLVKMVSAKTFGVSICPNIYAKAAFYAEKIISDHIFFDGNKRTGLISAMFFLTINGFDSISVTDTHLVNLGFSIAKGTFEFQEIEDWFRKYYSF